MRIYFVGSHATGKTTMTRWVSRRYGLPMIISRLMGLLLAALAVQFMVNALTGDQGLLRGLTGH